jgi:hypothetical protein
LGHLSWARKKGDEKKRIMNFGERSGCKILVFFLHRHSQVRADMPDCIPVFLSIQQSMSAYATHGYARAGMISGFADLFAGHVKRGACSRDAGASGKSKDPNERLFSLYPNPAQDAKGMCEEIQQRDELPKKSRPRS